MLKKFNDTGGENSLFGVGAPVFVVTRQGEVLEGYTIKSRLLQLFTLNCSPLDGTEKQGFTLKGEVLKPNWCEGKRKLHCVCATRQHADEMAQKITS